MRRIRFDSLENFEKCFFFFLLSSTPRVRENLKKQREEKRKK